LPKNGIILWQNLTRYGVKTQWESRCKFYSTGLQFHWNYSIEKGKKTTYNISIFLAIILEMALKIMPYKEQL